MAARRTTTEVAPAPASTAARGAKDSGTAATVARAVDILMYFSEVDSRDLGVTEIADALGLSKTAVHRILTSLRVWDLVELDETTRRYRLGVGVMRLGTAYLDRLDLRQMARQELVSLSARTSETATLSMRSGKMRAYVDQVTPNREVIMSVTLGEVFPLHAGASSKAFLAFLPEPAIEDYISAGLAPLTERTKVDPDALLRELAEVRKNGYASSDGERKSGAASVAAPVFDHTGAPIAVISVCGPSERFVKAAAGYRELLLESTARLSLAMGGLRL